MGQVQRGRKSGCTMRSSPTEGTGFTNWPSWTPDGEGIIFSAGDNVDDWENPGPIEIWKLDSVLDVHSLSGGVPRSSGDKEGHDTQFPMTAAGEKKGHHTQFPPRDRWRIARV